MMVLVSGLLFGLHSQATAQEQAGRKPNIVYVLTDQWRAQAEIVAGGKKISLASDTSWKCKKSHSEHYGDWDILRKYSGFEFDDANPKGAARTKYDNIMYLERPGCNLCMGNQEKAEPGDTVIATSTRLFQGRVVADSAEKKGESLLGSTPLVVLSSVLGRFPTIEEYKAAVEGIDLTRFAPPTEEMSTKYVPIKMV